jgi:hypothetical protein
MVPPEEEAMHAQGLVITVDDKGPVPPLVSSSPFLFSQKRKRFFLPFLSLDRFVG